MRILRKARGLVEVMQDFDGLEKQGLHRGRVTQEYTTIPRDRS